MKFLSFIVLICALGGCTENDLASEHQTFSYPPSKHDPSSKTPIIIDTDLHAEIDDFSTVFFGLTSQDKLDIRGITTSESGPSLHKYPGANSAADNARGVKNTLMLAGPLGSNIPVREGASKGRFSDIAVHLDEGTYEGHAAVNFIIEEAHRQHERSQGKVKLTLAAIGTATNLALALAKDPSIEDKVRIFFLGTNYTTTAEDYEWNLVYDAPAIQYILEESSVEFHIVIAGFGKMEDIGTANRTFISFDRVYNVWSKLGPYIEEGVNAGVTEGKREKVYHTFGELLVDLWKSVERNNKKHGRHSENSLYESFLKKEDIPIDGRGLYDTATLAIIMDPTIATSHYDYAKEIHVKEKEPRLSTVTWTDSTKTRKITTWTHLDRDRFVSQVENALKKYTIPVEEIVKP